MNNKVALALLLEKTTNPKSEPSWASLFLCVTLTLQFFQPRGVFFTVVILGVSKFLTEIIKMNAFTKSIDFALGIYRHTLNKPQNNLHLMYLNVKRRSI